MFGESFVAALRAAGVAPDQLPGRIRRAPVRGNGGAVGCAGCGRTVAVITRELARGAAHRLGHRTVFSPMPAADGVGNGVHIHMSLLRGDRPLRPPRRRRDQWVSACRRNSSARGWRGTTCRRSAAITAPSPVSYLTADAEPLGADAGGHRAKRIAAPRCASARCSRQRTPEEIARQFNVEFRVCDSAASPYMALGAVLFAGADGLRRKLALPAGQEIAAVLATLAG